MASADPATQGRTVGWLLGEDNPSVRFLALRELSERPPSARALRIAQAQVMEAGPVPRILSTMDSRGYWGGARDFYMRTKYRGTVWSFLLLAQLGADGSDERIGRAAEFLLDWSQDPASGGFAFRGSESGGAHEDVLPCLTGNLVWALIRFGYVDDPRVRLAVDWIAAYQRFDDGVATAPEGWPYRLEKCWGTHTCHMGAAKALKALAEIPPPKRSRKVQETIEDAAEYFLRHRIFKRSHAPSRVSIPAWTRFGFPLLWNSDALEVFDLLARLGYRDARMREAHRLILSKRTADGRWLQEDGFQGRMQVRTEPEGRPSKWVTCRALRALRAYAD